MERRKRFRALPLLGLLLTLGGCSCACPAESCEFVSSLPARVQETSLEGASQFIGHTIPVPTHLPRGWRIRRVFVEPHPKEPSWSTVTLLISDREVDLTLVTDTDEQGHTRQYYEFKCKMEMSMDWRERRPGLPPCDPGVSCWWVDVGGAEGLLIYNPIYNTLLWWPNPRNEPGFPIWLSVGKGISGEEIIQIAESTLEEQA